MKAIILTLILLIQFTICSGQSKSQYLDDKECFNSLVKDVIDDKKFEN